MGAGGQALLKVEGEVRPPHLHSFSGPQEGRLQGLGAGRFPLQGDVVSFNLKLHELQNTFKILTEFFQDTACLLLNQSSRILHYKLLKMIILNFNSSVLLAQPALLATLALSNVDKLDHHIRMQDTITTR